RHAAALELANHVVAVGHPDHVDEPAGARGPWCDRRQRDAVHPVEAARVPLGDSRAPGEDLVEAVELRGAERRAELGEAVVVAEPRVRQPSVEHVPALVAEAPEERIPAGVPGDDHAAFAGRHLLVRVEAEYASVAEGAGRPAAILAAD